MPTAEFNACPGVLCNVLSFHLCRAHMICNFRDMYEHLQNVIKLGPMGKFMDMLPGLPQGMMKGKEKESTQHLKVFMTMMDSMTDFELDHGQVVTFPSTPFQIPSPV